MNLLKQIVKVVGWFAAGIAIGLIVAAVIVVVATDTTLAEFVGKLRGVRLTEIVTAAAIGMASFVVSVALLIVIHEGGHLVCGLLSGYRFVSFRVFNLTFIRQDGRLRVKRFAVAGTGGQCLLWPPDKEPDDIPVALYNMGGILANAVALVVVLPLLWVDMSPAAYEFVAIFLLTDLFMLLLNGIPMSAGGVGNDAYNMLLLRRSPMSRRALVVQLRANAMAQAGIRPRDMPEGWFVVPADIDYGNALEVSVSVMAASRLVDMKEWERAYDAFAGLYEHRDEIMALYVKEIACEMVFLALVTGRMEQAQELYDGIERYVMAYRKVMSSKERILCAVTLYLKHDREAALEIYHAMQRRRGEYLLQGEVASDLDLMHDILEK